jgi:hypothetical protein
MSARFAFTFRIFIFCVTLHRTRKGAFEYNALLKHRAILPLSPDRSRNYPL